MAGIRRNASSRATVSKRRKSPGASGRRKVLKPALPPDSIWAQLIAIGESIPAEALALLPRDGASNLDHYLYGAPKEE